MNDQQLGITFHDNEIPSFVEPTLEAMYGNIFSSLTHHRVSGIRVDNLSTYLVRSHGRILALFLFRLEGDRVQVLNEGIRIDSVEIARFSEQVFLRYPQVNVIGFRAIQTDIKRYARPFQRFNYLEDMVLPLPATAELYQASLNKHTRRNIKRYLERLQRNFPSFRFETYECEDISEDVVHRIIDFNRARMASKHIVSAIDAQEAARIVALARACGLMGIITIDGQPSAGAIAYQSGDNYFLNVLAHDSRYDEHGLGLLCCYLTILKSIERGGNEFHLLWGRYDYKLALLARQRDLDSVLVYRSRLQMMRHAGLALCAAWYGHRRQVKLWVKYENSFLSQQALQWVNRLRQVKRYAASLAGQGEDFGVVRQEK